MIRITIQVLLIMACLVALWALAPRVREALHPPALPMVSPNATSVANSAAPSLPELALPSFERLTHLLNAPIFFSSRKLPRAEAVSVTAEQDGDREEKARDVARLKLFGIMMHGNKRRAIMGAAGGAPRWFDQGDTIAGWRIDRIEPGFVVVRKNGRTERIDLYKR